MKISSLKQLQYLALLMIILGTGLGIFGSVRSGALVLALGTTTFVTINYYRADIRRRIELIIPLGMCLVLITVALTLPHAK
jgi:hypothetical protein